MSTENNEARDSSLPDIPSDHPANAGAIDSMQNHAGMPPLDWDGPPVDSAAKGKAKADWEATKEQAVQAEPSSLSRAGRYARHHGLKDLRIGAQAAEQGQAASAAAAAGHVAHAANITQVADAAAPASKTRKPRATKTNAKVEVIAKPPRKVRATAAAAEADAQVRPAGAAVAKPARTRSKVASKTGTQEQAQPAASAAPAPGAREIPPMTPEAIAFLRNPDAKAADLFKLQPESQAFVQCHITNVQRLEAESELNYSYLLSTAPKYSPAFEKVADALVAKLEKDRSAGVKLPAPNASKPAAAQAAEVVNAPSPATAQAAEVNVPSPAAAQMTGASYREKPTGTQQSVSINLGKMEIGLEQQARADRAADIQWTNRILGTAHMMMSAPIGDVTREQATDLVAGDVEDFRAIRGEQARQQALNAMMESSHAQPRYKDAFERLAPELVALANEARAVSEATRVGQDGPNQSAPEASEQTVENSIERGIAPERENQPDKTQPAPGIGKRMWRAIGGLFQGRAEERPAAAPVSGAKPLPLDKQDAPKAPAAPADNKDNVMPEAVARRFLKVNQDYYFHDRTLAFSDRGNKLATRGAHPDVVRSLIEVAQARGWDSVTVNGTKAFRRSAWMEATQAGLKVKGYKPTALDLAELSNKPTTNTVEKGIAKEREASAAQQSKLTAAAQASAAKAADTAPSPELEAKARAFEKEKPGFVMRKYPELAHAYGVVDAARKFAEANLPHDVREEFVSLARRHVMQKILAGEQVKGPQIYAAPAKAKDGAEQAPAPEQPAVDLGKAERSKDVARER